MTLRRLGVYAEIAVLAVLVTIDLGFIAGYYATKYAARAIVRRFSR